MLKMVEMEDTIARKVQEHLSLQHTRKTKMINHVHQAFSLYSEKIFLATIWGNMSFHKSHLKEQKNVGRATMKKSENL
jgi:hypothetical protein